MIRMSATSRISRRRIKAASLPLVLLVGLLAAMPAMVQAQGSEASSDAKKAVNRFFQVARSGDIAEMNAASAKVIEAGPAAAELVMKGIKSRTPQEIVAGLRLVRAAGGEQSLDQVLELADHRNPEVRAEVCVYCGFQESPAVVPYLHRGSADPSATVRRRAFDALLRMQVRDPRTLSAACNGLFDKDFWVSGQAGRILGAWPPVTRGPDPVAKALATSIPRLGKTTAPRVFAILGHRMEDQIAPLVKRGLSHRNSAVVLAAIKVAADRRLRATYPKLRELLKRRDEVAVAAVRALGTVKDKKAVPLLVRMLSGRLDEVLRDAVAVSLRYITGKTYGFDRSKWEEYLDSGLVAEVASKRR
jgi:HEAT repeat protein